MGGKKEDQESKVDAASFGGENGSQTGEEVILLRLFTQYFSTSSHVESVVTVLSCFCCTATRLTISMV